MENARAIGRARQLRSGLILWLDGRTETLSIGLANFLSVNVLDCIHYFHIVIIILHFIDVLNQQIIVSACLR